MITKIQRRTITIIVITIAVFTSFSLFAKKQKPVGTLYFLCAEKMVCECTFEKSKEMEALIKKHVTDKPKRKAAITLVKRDCRTQEARDLAKKHGVKTGPAVIIVNKKSKVVFFADETIAKPRLFEKAIASLFNK